MWWLAPVAIAGTCDEGDREACGELLPSLSASAAAAISLELGARDRLRALELALRGADPAAPMPSPPMPERLIEGTEAAAPLPEGWSEAYSDGVHTVLLADPAARGPAWVSGPRGVREYPLPADRCAVGVAHWRIAIVHGGCRKVTVRSLVDWSVVAELALDAPATAVAVGPEDVAVLQRGGLRWIEDTGRERWSGPMDEFGAIYSFGTELYTGTTTELRLIGADGGVRRLPYRWCLPRGGALSCWTELDEPLRVPPSDPDAARPPQPGDRIDQLKVPIWHGAGKRRVTVATAPGATVWLFRVAREISPTPTPVVSTAWWPAGSAKADARGRASFEDLAAGTAWVVATGADRSVVVPESESDWEVAIEPGKEPIPAFPPRTCRLELAEKHLAETSCDRIGAVEPSPEDHPFEIELAPDGEMVRFRLARRIRTPALDPVVDWGAVPTGNGWATFGHGMLIAGSDEPVRLVGQQDSARLCATVDGLGLESEDGTPAGPCPLPERDLELVDPRGEPVAGWVTWLDPESGGLVRAGAGLDGTIRVPDDVEVRAGSGLLPPSRDERVVVPVPPRVSPGWTAPALGTWLDSAGRRLVLDESASTREVADGLPQPIQVVRRWTGGALVADGRDSAWFLLTSDDSAVLVGTDMRRLPEHFVRQRTSEDPDPTDRDRSRCAARRSRSACERLAAHLGARIARATVAGDVRATPLLADLGLAMSPRLLKELDADDVSAFAEGRGDLLLLPGEIPDEPVGASLSGRWLGPDGWQLRIKKRTIVSERPKVPEARWPMKLDWTGGAVSEGGIALLADRDTLVLIYGVRPVVFVRR